MVSFEELIPLLVAVAGIILAAITARWGTKYLQLKTALHQLVELMAELDAALVDDKVNEAEWMALYQKAQAFIQAVKDLIG